MSKKKKQEKVKAKDQKSGQKKSAAQSHEPAFWEKIPVLIPPPIDQWLGRICFAGIIALSFLMSFHALVDTDIFWHLKTGQIIFETHRVPHQDIFSFTVAGTEWIDSQWLFQLAIYIAYRIGGFAGMIFFGGILMALTWTLILVPGYSSKKYFRIIPLALVSLLAVSSRLRLRPEFFTFFFLALELFLLHLYRQGKRKALYPIPVLILLWVNSHGLWPMGLFILVAVLAEQVLALPWFGLQKYFKLAPGAGGKKAILELAVCLAVSALVIWINPYGWKGVVFPLKLLWEISSSGSFIGGYIGEFQSPFILNNPVVRPAYIALSVFSGLLFIFLIFSRRLYLADLIICGGVFYISATANRNVPLFAVVMAMLGGRLILDISEPGWSWIKRFSDPLLRVRPLAAGILIIAMVWLSGEIISSKFFIHNMLFCRFGIGASETDYPIRAGQFLKSIPELESAGPLKIFTDIHNAGYLIWAGYPAWKVYVDPRMELYGDQFIKKYSSLLANWQEFTDEDQKYDFDLVVVSAYRMETGSDFVRNLAHSSAWVLIYLDGKNVVFLKNRPSFSGAIQNYRMNLTEKLDTPLPKKQDAFSMVKERYNRGIQLLWLNHKELAVYEFEDGIKYDPRDPNLINDLGLTLNNLRRYPEALPYLEENAKNYPDDLPGQIQLGWALASTGKPDRAIMILRGVLNTSPNQISACIDLAKVFEMVKDQDRAYEQWLRCQEISRRDPIRFQRQGYEISEALKRLQK